ncbi:MAG TPA: DNA primase [Aestuariivirgaceae bacterium]|nr:DNA primase [Aestuariivirgaceae bacterium]
MQFSSSFLDEIRDRVTLSTVVGRAVQWDRRKSQAGRGDFWACCPFHTEKSPSFHADDRKGFYHCFGCKASGDVFTFMVEKEGLSFPEAVERLAAEAGLALPEAGPQEAARSAERASLHEVMEIAAKFFEYALGQPQGREARAYLAGRGLDDEVLRTFRIGFAPNDRYALKTHMAEAGISPDVMAEAGLVISGEDVSVSYDRFRNRIIFPIRDGRGRVIAFGGRAMSSDAQAKYLNSPDTSLFHKGTVLYNIDLARGPAHKHGTVVAVEGYMDVIALSRAGFDNAVAPLGTALTENQVALLWRLAAEPILCFDGDEAGRKAAFRALDLALPLLKPGHSLRFAFMPAGIDPDDLLRDEGPQALATALTAAAPLVEVLWRRALDLNDRATPERRARFESDLRNAAGVIGDAAVRSHYMAELADRMRGLWAAGRKSPPRNAPGRSSEYRGSERQRPGSQPPWARQPWARQPWGVQLPSSELRALAARTGRRHIHEQREGLILAALLNHPELLQEEAERLAETEFATPKLDRLRRQLLDTIALYQEFDGTSLKNQLSQSGSHADLARIEDTARRLGIWFVLADAALDDARTGFRQMMSLHRKAVTLERDLVAAERLLAETPNETNLAHLNQIRDELHSTAGSEASSDGFGEASGRSAGPVS